jgi:uncharacterized protein (TIGR03437 family)
MGNGGGLTGVNVIAGSNCSWVATSNAAWITVTGGGSGTGNGAVSISVAENTATTSRTGTVTIAGQTYTVQQSAAPVVIPCSYALSATSFSSDHLDRSLSLQVSTGSTCSWTAVSNVSWLSVAPGNGTGNGTLTIQVQANATTNARSGALTVAGQTVTVNQSGQPVLPSVAVSPSQLVISAKEGSKQAVSTTVSVNASQPNVSFSVGGPLPGWLSATASSSSTPATVTFSANPSGLPAGTYTATVPVYSTGTANPVVNVGVTFQVQSPVNLRASPRSLSFSTKAGQDQVLVQSVRVQVAGSSSPIRAYVDGGTWLSASAELVRNAWVIRAAADPRGLNPGVYDAVVGLGCMTGECAPLEIPVRMQVSTVSQSDSGSAVQKQARIASGGVVNAASFQQGITEGSWMSIFGENLADETALWKAEDFDGPRFPRSVGGVQVKVDGKPAAIHFASPNQVNFQAPSGIAKGWVLVEIHTPNGSDQAFTYSTKENPGLFQINPDGQVAALFPDGRAVGRLPEQPETGGKWTPARPGETIAVYGTGFGPTDPHVEAGEIFQGAAELITKGAVQVLIGGQTAAIQFVGLSGAGLNQLNVVVPALPRGDHEILAIVDGAPTQFVGKIAID